MPIEREIEKQHGKNLPVEKTQSLCRAYAAEQIERQKKDFQRLGVLGDWDDPYLTMAYQQRGRRDPRARQAPAKRLRLPRA